VNKIFNFGKHLSGFLLAIFFVFVATDVFARNVLEIPIIWLNEGSVFAFQWMTFIAGAICFFENLHFRVTILPERLEIKYRIPLTIIELAANCAFGAILLVQGIQLTIVNLKSFSPAMGICTAWIVVVIPLAAVAIILSVLAKTASLIREMKGGNAR